jgi:hypothetical protein
METTIPRPDEKNVRDGFLNLLREQGLTPQEGWIAMRLVNDGTWAGMYMVLVAEHAARVVLSLVLPYATAAAGNEVTGVWLLGETEARQLCAGA